jgi:bifunctional non-homologous end joining protein LigD
MTLPTTFMIDAPGDAVRAAELRRIKWLATLLLATTFALFIAARAFVHVHPTLGFVAAFAAAILRLHRTVPAVEGGAATVGPFGIHEIKHDGYRLMVRRDGARVRCFTRDGHDWADRFPSIVDAAHRIKAQSFLIDGEPVIINDDGTPDFRALRSRRRGHEAVLFAFDLIEHDGDDLRDLPLIDRKRRLARLIGRATGRAIRYSEHLTGDGPTVVRACLPDRAGGHRVEAAGFALSQRAVEGMAQIEEPGKRGCQTRARGVALARPSCCRQ